MATTVRLKILTGPHKDSKYCFCGQTRCQVGRASDCFVELSGTERDRLISRHHCQLDIDPPVVHVADLRSSNGTYVNGKKVGPIPVDLADLPGADNFADVKDGDLITVGGTTFQVEVVDCPQAAQEWQGSQFGTQDRPQRRIVPWLVKGLMPGGMYMNATAGRFLTQRAWDLMSRCVIVIPKDTLLSTAARLLAQAGVTGAPVVDESGRCIGVLSNSDFVRPDRLNGKLVADVMTKDPVTVLPRASIRELARRMLAAHIHRVIVVDREEHPVGIVSSTDIVATILHADKEH